MDGIRSTATPDKHGAIVVNPDGTNIGDPLPITGNNPSLTVTEVVVGTETTTTIQKVIGATTYTKTVVEDTSTGITTISAWSTV